MALFSLHSPYGKQRVALPSSPNLGIPLHFLYHGNKVGLPLFWYLLFACLIFLEPLSSCHNLTPFGGTVLFNLIVSCFCSLTSNLGAGIYSPLVLV